MTVFHKALAGLFVGLVAASVPASVLYAAEAYPVFTDIDQGAAEVYGVRAAPFGSYVVDSNASLNGNAVLGVTQNAIPSCCHGNSVVAALSNGENGDGGPEGTDPANPTPANSVFTTIGNASGRLEDGNVIRFSAWFRSNPDNPITVEPQVAPILKVEYWTQGLSGTADTTGVKAQPTFGDRIYDQDQQGYAIGVGELPTYVDINGDGMVVHDTEANAGNGRLFGLSTDHWTLAQVTHTVDSGVWLGIGPTSYGAFDVTKIEAVKGIAFWGEFDVNTDTSPDGPDGGSLLVDNVLLEVFKDAASVTPINSPDPALSEVVGLPGDYNGDGWVDAADYTVWRDHLGNADESSLNGNGDGMNGVDAGDYTRWVDNFGTHSEGAGALSGNSAVPEPGTWVLGTIALVLLRLMRRSKNGVLR